MKTAKLDQEEQELLDAVERGEWKSVSDLKGEIQRHQHYARNTLKKDRRVNIRVSSKDLEELQTIAVTDGIPYQTLMSSVLHRFVNGLLVDSRAGRAR
jgi:predicted DNA binding CopG/RHH family protein